MATLVLLLALIMQRWWSLAPAQCWCSIAQPSYHSSSHPAQLPQLPQLWACLIYAYCSSSSSSSG
jgi:hypothetical protein